MSLRITMAALPCLALLICQAVADAGTPGASGERPTSSPEPQPTTRPIKLTWDDLLMRDLNRDDVLKCLTMWQHRLEGRVATIYASRFGDWFLQRPDGSTVKLSVLEGTCEKVADTPDQFTTLLNTQEWQEKHLLSREVYQLHLRGVIPGKGQCYAPVPHPRLAGGKLVLDEAIVMGLVTWQRICSELDKQAR